MMENPGKMDENWGKPHDQEETSNSKTHGNSLVAEKIQQIFWLSITGFPGWSWSFPIFVGLVPNESSTNRDLWLWLVVGRLVEPFLVVRNFQRLEIF